MKKLVLIIQIIVLAISVNAQQLNGEFINYYPSGQLKNKQKYVNGQQIGESIHYFENGQIEAKCFFVKGKYHGESVGYHENGTLRYRKNYVNGKLNGEYIFYYDNGQIEYKEIFVNDLRNGERTSYYKDGQVNENGFYKNGKTIKLYSYYSSGKLKRVEECTADESCEATYYYETGELEMKSKSMRNNPLGSVSFNKDGSIKNKWGLYANATEVSIKEETSQAHQQNEKVGEQILNSGKPQQQPKEEKLVIEPASIGTKWTNGDENTRAAASLFLMSTYNGVLTKTGTTTFTFKWENAKEEVVTEYLTLKSSKEGMCQASALFAQEKCKISEYTIKGNADRKAIINWYSGKSIDVILYNDFGELIGNWHLTKD